MSDFFGALKEGNVRYTDSRINGDGPLPTTLSGPEGINGDPDGKYNFNSELLSGITPYAYGQGRMGSDRNYQQIPHRKQFPVPPVFLPEPDLKTQATFMMSHPVDFGDIVFILNVKNKQIMLTPKPYSASSNKLAGFMPDYNILVNICTVNYILAGLYNCIIDCVVDNEQLNSEPNRGYSWHMLANAMNLSTGIKELQQWRQNEYSLLPEDRDERKLFNSFLNMKIKVMLQNLLKTVVRPMGIAQMSEKQGGQHEVGIKPVQFASDFFTTLTVDGQNRDVVNIWRGLNIEAGDHLIFRLDYEPKQTRTNFTLNHYYKHITTKQMPMTSKMAGKFQLIPDVYKLSHDSNKFGCSYIDSENIAHDDDYTLDRDTWMKILSTHVKDYRTSGYWHIGQTYTKKERFSTTIVPVNDMEQTHGQLLQINFAPVWKQELSNFHDDGNVVQQFINAQNADEKNKTLLGIMMRQNIYTHAHALIQVLTYEQLLQWSPESSDDEQLPVNNEAKMNVNLIPTTTNKMSIKTVTVSDKNDERKEDTESRVKIRKTSKAMTNKTVAAGNDTVQTEPASETSSRENEKGRSLKPRE